MMRILMSSNMQHQAVPLSRSEKCIVGTGLEQQAALDSGALSIAERGGTPPRAAKSSLCGLTLPPSEMHETSIGGSYLDPSSALICYAQKLQQALKSLAA
ncbi:hypothetical protein ACH5RR_032499 [Cinchona calisaya]|uniref:Uncharacterized protein n=1 Tax=Cinchona calisaya TaxID=153742 RepID=A0ABD2YI88_9GENT